MSIFLIISFLFTLRVNAEGINFYNDILAIKNGEKVIKATTEEVQKLAFINEKYIYEGEQLNCDDFMTKDEENAINNYNLVQKIFDIIMFLGPVLLIVYGTLDFAKASLSGDESALRKAGSNFGKRVLALVLLILIPFIVSAILQVAFDAGVFGEGLSEIPDVCITE